MKYNSDSLSTATRPSSSSTPTATTIVRNQSHKTTTTTTTSSVTTTVDNKYNAGSITTAIGTIDSRTITRRYAKTITEKVQQQQQYQQQQYQQQPMLVTQSSSSMQMSPTAAVIIDDVAEKGEDALGNFSRYHFNQYDRFVNNEVVDCGNNNYISQEEELSYSSSRKLKKKRAKKDVEEEEQQQQQQHAQNDAFLLDLLAQNDIINTDRGDEVAGRRRGGAQHPNRSTIPLPPLAEICMPEWKKKQHQRQQQSEDVNNMNNELTDALMKLEQQLQVQQQQATTVVARPTPLKVVRPVPKRAVEAFYDAVANDKEVAEQSVQKAMAAANEWHRKWTHQDERGHDVVKSIDEEEEEDCYVNEYAQKDSLVWARLLAADREAFARNPSPDDDNEDEMFVEVERHEDRYASDSVQQQQRNNRAAAVLASVAPSEDEYVGVEVMPSPATERNKRGRVMITRRNSSSISSTISSDDERDVVPIQQPQHAQIVRPKALRVSAAAKAPVRPVAVRPGQEVQRLPSLVALPEEQGQEEDLYRVRPPFDYVLQPNVALVVDDDSMRSTSTRRSISPLTIASISSRKSQQHHQQTPSDEQYHQQTQLEQQEVNVIEEEEEDVDIEVTNRASSSWIVVPNLLPTAVSSARDGILLSLAVTGGETTSTNFQTCLNILIEHYQQELTSCHHVTSLVDTTSVEHGMWLTLTKPTFFGNLGENDRGDPMYTLGRMSFDMFSPTGIVCSLQGNFNSIETVSKDARAQLLQTHRDNQDHYCSIPKKFQLEIESGETEMRTYDIVTAFTIEPPVAAYPKAPNKDVNRPIRGIMSTYGYSLPDPENPNRQSIWITGGKIEPNNDVEDQKCWKQLFGAHPPTHAFSEKAKLLAVKLLMGATFPEQMDPETGVMEYTFTRPLGGHGMAYIDTIYCDPTMRIVRGHRGTVFVFSRLPQNETK